MMKPSYERIKFLQNQLRTAIQNHHVLYVKSRLTPQDSEIKNQINVLQSLIVSMGRTQNELMEQLERELESNQFVRSEVSRHLCWELPNNLPVFPTPYPRQTTAAPLKTRDEESGVKQSQAPGNPRVYSRMHSLLKPVGNKTQEASAGAWTAGARKLQSVLKSKAPVELVKGFIRIQSDTTKICGDRIKEEDNSTGAEGGKRRRTDDSLCRSRSTSPTAKAMPLPLPHPRRKIVESKLWTRSKKRLAVEAATAAAKAASFSGNSEKDINNLEETLKNEPIDATLPVDEKILKNLSVYEEIGKAKFLESFNLISMSEKEAIRVKKCGRKRRTAAGTSTLYNDFFQHSALSMKNAKWRYEMEGGKRGGGGGAGRAAAGEGGKKSGTLLSSATKRVVSPQESLTASASAEASPEEEEGDGVVVKAELEPDAEATTAPTPNSIVVEAPHHIEEDDDKDRICILCRTSGEEGLEMCVMCGEKYHRSCSHAESEGRCSLCFAQISGIDTIVGGEAGVSSSSSLEVIKRYLPS